MAINSLINTDFKIEDILLLPDIKMKTLEGKY